MILKVQLTSLHLSSALNSLCPGCRKSNRKWPLPSMMIRPLHTYNSTKITNDLKCHIDRLSLIHYTHSHIYIVVLIQFQSSCLALQLCNCSVGSCPHISPNSKTSAALSCSTSSGTASVPPSAMDQACLDSPSASPLAVPGR